MNHYNEYHCPIIINNHNIFFLIYVSVCLSVCLGPRTISEGSGPGSGSGTPGPGQGSKTPLPSPGISVSGSGSVFHPTFYMGLLSEGTEPKVTKIYSEKDLGSAMESVIKGG